MIAFHEALEDWAEVREEPAQAAQAVLLYWDAKDQVWVMADTEDSIAALSERYRDYVVIESAEARSQRALRDVRDIFLR